MMENTCKAAAKPVAFPFLFREMFSVLEINTSPANFRSSSLPKNLGPETCSPKLIQFIGISRDLWSGGNKILLSDARILSR